MTTVEGRFHSDSPAETESIGARLAASLRGGDIVLLDGELGAGKTTFVRGACRALGVRVPVTSPTFTIGQRYPVEGAGAERVVDVFVAHLDLYRLSSLADEDPELLDDYLGPGSIAFVEWARDQAGELDGAGRIAARVAIEHAGGDARLITVGPAAA